MSLKNGNRGLGTPDAPDKSRGLVLRPAEGAGFTQFSTRFGAGAFGWALNDTDPGDESDFCRARHSCPR